MNLTINPQTPPIISEKDFQQRCQLLHAASFYSDIGLLLNSIKPTHEFDRNVDLVTNHC